jgi:DNA invertase Pin-like site-specific DNA recombinase
MALIGYVRVSTAEQSLDLQKDALVAAGVDPQHLYEDVASGAKQQRPGLAMALKACRAGDTLVLWRLDRLGRNLLHLIQTIAELKARGVDVRTLTGLNVDTSTAHGEFLLQIYAALAQYERELIRERVHAGLAAARARGRKGGRKPVLSAEQQRLARAMLQTATIVDTAKTFGVSRNTLYRMLQARERDPAG